MKSIAQERAVYAWKCAVKNKDNKEYASLVRKVPMYIKTNGLLNTLAFLYSKGEREKQVLKEITEWLTNKDFGLIDRSALKNPNSDTSLIEYLLHAEPHTVIACTAEILNLFTWLRRFVKDTNDDKKS
ncbi:MAG: type III-B CRISPR module-associated protein Cmr5 [Bacteroidia bacterium]|nr:type III-B CRISPR module-associated protein Cmr5 [Bacteroidia bacterium]